MFVNSTAIQQASYSRKHRRMLVVFNSAPNTAYIHDNVTRYRFDRLVRAGSIGRYYNKNIRGKYQGDKIVRKFTPDSYSTL